MDGLKNGAKTLSRMGSLLDRFQKSLKVRYRDMASAHRVVTPTRIDYLVGLMQDYHALWWVMFAIAAGAHLPPSSPSVPANDWTLKTPFSRVASAPLKISFARLLEG